MPTTRVRMADGIGTIQAKLGSTLWRPATSALVCEGNGDSATCGSEESHTERRGLV
jgi:hypothetical protein